MKTKLLFTSAFTALFFMGFSQAQYSSASAKPAGLSFQGTWHESVTQKQNQKSTNIVDESGYYFNNAYVMNNGSGNYDVDPLKVWPNGATGATASTFSQAEQFIPNTANITLEEVSFLGMAMDNSASVTAVVVIQDKAFNYIAHEFVTVSSFNKYTATLSSPVSLNDTFMVVVAPYSDADSLYIGVTNDYANTLPYSGNGYFVEYSTATQSFVNAFTPGNGGGDFIIWPSVSYNFGDVTASSNCISTSNQTISFTSPNEGVVSNPIWNYNAWVVAQGAPTSGGYYYTNFEVVEDSYLDSNQVINFNYTFSIPNNYTVNYTERIYPWTNGGNIDQLNTFNITNCSTSPITVSYTSSDISCNGLNDGTATVVISGGVAPYNYLWDDINAQTSSTATALIAGTYTVTITDANSTIATQSVVISEPSALNLTNISSVDATCIGCADGTATVTVSGGVAPYTYLWDDINAQTSSIATGLTAGNYTMSVTDANGCNDAVTVVVNENSATALNGLKDSELLVYPNPTSDYVIFNIQNANSIIVKDVLGRNIIIQNVSNFSKIDVSMLKEGTYLYKVLMSNNKFLVGKFIVKK